MTTVSTTGSSAADTIKSINSGPENVQAQPSAYASLGQGDFLKLMITQLQQQDPFEPVDNKEMLAQMAQFSALAGSTETNETLADISGKLDALIAAQKAANLPTNNTKTDTPTA